MKVSFLIKNRELLVDLIKREFAGRYKGSLMGVAWAIINPLFLLSIYTFVFTIAFKARWGTHTDSKFNFALLLFSGMIVHSFFAECLNRAPTLISSTPNYVKKVVFPLEILPCVVIGSSLLNFVLSFIILLLFCFFAGTPLNPGILLTPVLMFPLILTTTGLSWLLSSSGVYFRDLAQGMGMLTTVAMFLAPVFYSIESLPEAFQSLLILNPITLPIMQIRNVLFWNKPVLWLHWSFSLAVGVAVYSIGFWWFQKSKEGFADVL